MKRLKRLPPNLEKLPPGCLSAHRRMCGATRAIHERLEAATRPHESSLLIAPSGYRVCGCLRVRTRRFAVQLTLVLLFLAYLTKEASNAVLPVILDPLADASRDGDVVSLLPGFQTAFYAAGKLAQIPLAFISQFAERTRVWLASS